MVQWFARFIYHKYYHHLCSRWLQYWIVCHNIFKFRESIFKFENKDIGIHELEHIILGSLQTCGCIDSIQIAMCQQDSGPINSEDEKREDVRELQHAFFTTYGKIWGMKCQATLFPSEIIGNVYFLSTAQNDKGAINISSLEK